MIKKVKKGFTLIELVVVIAVIAILSAVSVVAYVGITRNAKKTAANEEARTLKTILSTELTREDYVHVVYFDNGTEHYAASKNDDSLQKFVSWTYTFHYDSSEDKITATYSSKGFNYYANNTTTTATPVDAVTEEESFFKESLDELIWVAQGHDVPVEDDNYLVEEENAKGFNVKRNSAGNALVFEHTNGSDPVFVFNFEKK